MKRLRSGRLLNFHLIHNHKKKQCIRSIFTNQADLLFHRTIQFDQLKGKKGYIEDLCQLSELLTEQKYKSSYERVGKIIKQYASNSGG